jgi:hypothetical protein
MRGIMSKRVYTVIVRQLNGEEVKTFVKATSPGQAVMHVTRDTVDVRVSTQDDMLELVGTGTQVEDATT